MCGIIGYSGQRNALPILLDGLKRLEYRGYDSAGVAIVGSGLQVVKDKGFISDLESELPAIQGTTGLAHTRWATHGAPSKVNAHPHTDCTGKIALAHNGIIENHAALREELEAKGHVFRTETDTESLAHLIEAHYHGDLEQAVREALHEVRGSYAIAVVHEDEPDRVIGARNESPLVVGLAPDETFLASDVPALLKYTDKVVYVMDKEMVVLTPQRAVLKDLSGNAVHREPQRITWNLEDAEKGGFEHFMLKEIHETPKAIHETLLGRLANLEVNGFLAEDFTSVKLVACGTSYHAALVGKYIFEEIAKVPASAELASEYRYTQGAADRPLVILISQSGETADTLGAAREAKRRGCKTLAIANVIGSSLAREADKTVYTRAGVEIGVAATKTFVAELIVLYLIALRMGLDRGTLGYEEADRLKDELRSLPRAVLAVLEEEEEIRALAETYGKDAADAYYLGRHVNYPVAMEGALKLKEISYIHAEGYPAGEMKHGPIALIDRDMPVVVLAPRDPWYEKMLSQIEQAKSRGGQVIALATDGDAQIPPLADRVMWVPETPWLLSPVVTVIPLQLLAYHIASLRGLDVDQPRNLAKSVTVE